MRVLFVHVMPLVIIVVTAYFNPFIASCSKLLLIDGLSAILA